MLMQREPPSLLPILQLLHIWGFPPPAEKASPPRDKNNHSYIAIRPSVEESTAAAAAALRSEDQCAEGIQKILISVFLSPVGGTVSLTCSFAVLQHGLSISTQRGKETEAQYRLSLGTFPRVSKGSLAPKPIPSQCTPATGQFQKDISELCQS